MSVTEDAAGGTRERLMEEKEIRWGPKPSARESSFSGSDQKQEPLLGS